MKHNQFVQLWCARTKSETISGASAAAGEASSSQLATDVIRSTLARSFPCLHAHSLSHTDTHTQQGNPTFENVTGEHLTISPEGRLAPLNVHAGIVKLHPESEELLFFRSEISNLLCFIFYVFLFLDFFISLHVAMNLTSAKNAEEASVLVGSPLYCQLEGQLWSQQQRKHWWVWRRQRRMRRAVDSFSVFLFWRTVNTVGQWFPTVEQPFRHFDVQGTPMDVCNSKFPRSSSTQEEVGGGTKTRSKKVQPTNIFSLLFKASWIIFNSCVKYPITPTLLSYPVEVYSPWTPIEPHWFKK